ncbi:MAG: polysaccharide biosynthesis protein, partial [Clostridia bacterium]|nr:polysaccharide biosynthesis protein [Clostridia bacterium]
MLENAQNRIGRTFFSGVLLLTLSTISVKAIGLFYKIPMLSYLGAEGMGYFNSAYEIYALFCVIATAGLPVALSVLISAAMARCEEERAERIYRLALRIFLGIGILGSLLMLLFARRFCGWIKNENAYLCMLSISPTVFLICLASALRGYFQGHQRMLPTALSQLLEAIGKLGFGLLLARWALAKGYDTPTVAAFAGLGLTLGEVLSVLYLILEKLRFHGKRGRVDRGERSESADRYVLRDLARLSLPMTLGASLVSLTKLIDMTMILRRLQSIGYSEALANEAYGSYTTLALSLYGLLPSLINSVSIPLVPILSAAISSGDLPRQQQMVKLSYRLTAFFAIPASLGLSAFARPVLSLLFGKDPASVALAA